MDLAQGCLRRAPLPGCALAFLLLAAGCGGATTTVTVTRTHPVTTTRTVTKKIRTPAAPCLGIQLAGTFTLVPGSAGAGGVAYVLTLKNTSQSRCYVSGLPKVQLLGAAGAPLPTRVAPTQKTLIVRVALAPGHSAQAHARFSPDVIGPGDSQTGACQPTALTLQVTPNGGGATAAPIRPPTSVCLQGTLHFDTYAAAS
jgi:hypothetical protein